MLQSRQFIFPGENFFLREKLRIKIYQQLKFQPLWLQPWLSLKYLLHASLKVGKSTITIGPQCNHGMHPLSHACDPYYQQQEAVACKKTQKRSAVSSSITGQPLYVRMGSYNYVRLHGHSVRVIVNRAFWTSLPCKKIDPHKRTLCSFSPEPWQFSLYPFGRNDG